MTRPEIRWRRRLYGLLDQLDDRARSNVERNLLTSLRQVCDLSDWIGARNLAAALGRSADHGTGFVGCSLLFDEIDLATCALTCCGCEVAG